MHWNWPMHKVGLFRIQMVLLEFLLLESCNYHPLVTASSFVAVKQDCTEWI